MCVHSDCLRGDLNWWMTDWLATVSKETVVLRWWGVKHKTLDLSTESIR